MPITLQGHWAHKHRALWTWTPNIIISGPFHHGGKCLRKKDRNVTMPECKAGGPSRGSTARTGTRAGTCSRCQFTQHCSIKSCVRYDDLKAHYCFTYNNSFKKSNDLTTVVIVAISLWFNNLYTLSTLKNNNTIEIFLKITQKNFQGVSKSISKL